MTTLRPFYVILRDDDPRLVRHESYERAINEAKRLAEKEPKHGFVVLQTVKLAGPIQPAVPLRDFHPDADEQIPF